MSRNLEKLKNDFVNAALARGYGNPEAKLYEGKRGEELGLSVSKDGVPHAVRIVMPTTAKEVIDFLDEWYATRHLVHSSQYQKQGAV